MTARSEAMRDALKKGLEVERLGGTDSLYQVEFPGGDALAVRIDAIPAALSVAAARERVGQPFMVDHRHAMALDQNSLPGVLHIIACHRVLLKSRQCACSARQML